MKITDHFLAIPPHLSVEWKEVASLQNDPSGLSISLKNGDKILLSHLTPEEIGQIFAAHQRHLSQSVSLPRKLPIEAILEEMTKMEMSKELPIHKEMPLLFRMIPAGGLSFPFHHNQEQADLPRLPEEVLEKLISVLQMVMPGLIESTPPPTPSCSCPFCQIASHVHQKIAPEEPSITVEDLRFRDWDVKRSDDQLYTVENPLDPLEKYTVFLGTPIGCTCGKNGCDHLIAVLKSYL